jgi:hypothetical protein
MLRSRNPLHSCPGVVVALALILSFCSCSSGGGETDRPPTVQISSPVDGASFAESAELTVTASASGRTGVVTTVEFYVDGTLMIEDISTPYEFIWDAETEGEYELKAVARDDAGLSSSDTITIEVAHTIRVPDDQGTVQAGIDAAVDGDFILIAPGTYTENLEWEGKTLSLVSQFHTSGDENFIEQTILDGDGNPVLTIKRAGAESQVIGLTIQNGSDGIRAKSFVDVLYCRIIDNADGLDYEPDADFGGTGSIIGGGTVAHCLFENNTDDGIDLDYNVEALIRDNTIRNNGDDGIEIRMHSYTGQTLLIEIRDNLISGNEEDGIQIIAHTSETDRFIKITGNVIVDSVMAGVGFMDGGQTTEDYRGAQIIEPVHLINNTFSGNEYGVTGGGNQVVVNNIFANSRQTGLLRLKTFSHAAYNIFWNNDRDHHDSFVDETTTFYEDPELSGSYSLSATSPAIDAGVASFSWNGYVILDLSPGDYSGIAPDLGAVELDL